LAMLIVGCLYFFVKTRNFESTWNDIRDGLLLFFSRSAIYRLAYADSPSKSWRPHFLVFSQTTDEHSGALLKFAQAISQSKGFLTMASFINPGTVSTLKRRELSKSLCNGYKKDKIQALVQIKEAERVTLGMLQMIDHHGLGPLKPNTVVFGGVRKEDESDEFVKVLRLAYRRHNNIVILNAADKLEVAEGVNLHIWWDEEYQSNSELMLVLGYMMQLDRSRKRSRLCIKAIVPNEIERKQKLEQLTQIALEKRLSIDVEVFVSADSATETVNIVKEFSKDADMIFFGLKPPPKDINEIDGYVVYLHGLSQAFEGIPLALVLSSEFTPLDTILE
ncbi:MAG TPA: hypothetical protein VGP47_11185, partial [Parachlamydiaceae bacterium]|nr:hypothetical protein [Parachlamydiaceae bacterium]